MKGYYQTSIRKPEKDGIELWRFQRINLFLDEVYASVLSGLKSITFRAPMQKASSWKL